MRLLRRSGYFAISVLGLVLFLFLATDILPGEREAVARTSLAISTVALVATVLFQLRQYRIIEHTLDENGLRAKPHLAVSTATLARDDWEKLEVDITLFNVGLGNLFVVASQMFWSATSTSPKNVSVGMIVGEEDEDERYPLVIEAGKRATLKFTVETAQMMRGLTEDDQLVSETTTPPSDFLEARIEIYYRGVGRDAAAPLVHHLHFADIRIASAIEPAGFVPTAPPRTLTPVAPARSRRR